MATTPSNPSAGDIGAEHETRWSATVSTSTTPYLTDHAIQGVAVLPGAAYIELGMQAAATVCGANAPLVLRSFDFQNMLFLSSETEYALTCSLSPPLDGACTFIVSAPTAGGSTGGRVVPYSTARIGVGEMLTADRTEIDPEAICRRADSHSLGPAFYRRLHEKGNEYGPAFQPIRELWIGRDEAVARIALPDGATGAQPDADSRIPHLVLMDACVQTLAAANSHSQGTYVLSSIEEVWLGANGRAPRWSYATVTSADSNSGELLGSVQLLDESGACVARLTGVRLRYMAQESSAVQAPEPGEATIAVAATFTPEPIEDSLAFWSRELALSADVAFAPYNQIFQQLLDPNSLLLQNKRGVNVLLVRPQDWTRFRGNGADADPRSAMDEGEQAALLRDQQTYTLPDGREIAHLNGYETAYVYQEIFVDRSYMKHGIQINDGDTILDIGANIGLFSLFALSQARDIQIYAFEPSPPANRALRANMALYGPRARVFDVGISDRQTAAEFTFYKNSSVFSSFYADEDDDAKAIRAVVENMVQTVAAPDSSPEQMQADVDALMQDRLNSQRFVCQLRSISDVIREEGIERIDLLKLDAEKSELAALRGIHDQDWPKIRQIVMEVHDREGAVLQEICALLRSRGFEIAIEEETFLQRSGLCNIFATRGVVTTSVSETDRETASQEQTRQNADAFVDALREASTQMAVPCIVCLCPPSPTNSQRNHAFFAKLDADLEARLSQIRSVHVVKQEELQRLYPTETLFDDQSDSLGHIPYTNEFYTALGTMVMRTFHALRRTPYKVIVLDCDETLWRGVVGEDGPHGIRVGESQRYLQAWMVQQQQAGMLLCLCSKNNEADVDAVFAQRTDMPLRAEHIVTRRVNWQPKSSNIRSLADELQLGLNSFIFLDDNPVECAEVRANCPEALTLQLPTHEDEIPRFLQHVWAFDHPRVTAEDRNRTRLYQENIQREQLRRQSISLSSFLAGLGLDTRIGPVQPDQLDRVAQLTQRTNQFNFTTRRRSAQEIEQAQRTGELECLAVHVSDRFGDYGLVGVVLFGTEEQQLSVDTFLLSCRVLGRGVEHRVLARLGEIAQERGLSHVQLEAIRTEKNQPAFDFLRNTVAPFLQEQSGHSLCRLPAAAAAAVTVQSDAPVVDELEAPDAPAAVPGSASADLELFERIANERQRPGQIMQLALRSKVKPRAVQGVAYVAPRNAHEQEITEIWKHVLELDAIGIHDNFMEIGGTSLRAVQLVAQMRQKLGLDISLIELFDTPTIGAIAARMQDAGGSAPAQQAQDARARAESRRLRRAARRGRRG